ncbi:hypothetical protein D3C81_2277920 [compost metagenome]
MSIDLIESASNKLASEAFTSFVSIDLIEFASNKLASEASALFVSIYFVESASSCEIPRSYSSSSV